MVHRRFWLKLLGRAWKERSVVWLAGVRRVGKTCLGQDLPEVEYFDGFLNQASMPALIDMNIRGKSITKMSSLIAALTVFSHTRVM